jgi:hypothetical protein
LVKNNGNTGEERASYMDLRSVHGLATIAPNADREARGCREQEKHPRTDVAACAMEAIMVDQNSVRSGKGQILANRHSHSGFFKALDELRFEARWRG